MDNHVSFGNIVFGLASAQPSTGFVGCAGIQHNRDTLAAFNIKNAIVNDTSTKKKKVTKSKEFFDIVKMKASYNEFCVMERYLLSV